MKVHDWEDVRRRKLTPGEIEENDRAIVQELLEMDLRALREALGKTQEEVARLAEMSQPQLSRAERQEDHRISTLRRIVRALGGELEIVARIGEQRILVSKG